jgi:hypothetical protein
MSANVEAYKSMKDYLSIKEMVVRLADEVNARVGKIVPEGFINDLQVALQLYFSDEVPLDEQHVDPDLKGISLGRTI